MPGITYEDSYALGLLYVYIYSNRKQVMVKLSDLRMFNECINNNLNVIKRPSAYTCGVKIDTPIYVSSRNETGEIYLILKHDLDEKRARAIYTTNMPSEYILASQMGNSLDALGLIKINGKIKAKIDVMHAKKDGEHCSNCEYVLTDEQLDSIQKENKEYKGYSPEELENAIGYCEMQKDGNVAKKLDCWCPYYLPNDEQELVLKKQKNLWAIINQECKKLCVK